jgi:hypothetical protein
VVEKGVFHGKAVRSVWCLGCPRVRDFHLSACKFISPSTTIPFSLSLQEAEKDQDEQKESQQASATAALVLELAGQIYKRGAGNGPSFALGAIYADYNFVRVHRSGDPAKVP